MERRIIAESKQIITENFLLKSHFAIIACVDEGRRMKINKRKNRFKSRLFTFLASILGDDKSFLTPHFNNEKVGFALKFAPKLID